MDREIVSEKEKLRSRRWMMYLLMRKKLENEEDGIIGDDKDTQSSYITIPDERRYQVRIRKALTADNEEPDHQMGGVRKDIALYRARTRNMDGEKLTSLEVAISFAINS